MASKSIINPPPLWTHRHVVLYHGTIDAFAADIVSGPIRTSLGKTHRDFGPGFYTTTVGRQAESWAAQISDTKSARAAVIEFHVPRIDLAKLDTLAFVRGEFDSEEFWSLVHYCRSGARDHCRPDPLVPYYDVVYGPVAGDWRQRMSFAGADQVSFHTPAAEAVLNCSHRKRII